MPPNSSLEDDVPRLENWKLEGARACLEGFAVASLAFGSALLALPDGERARLEQGDLVIVPVGASCEAGGPRSHGELLVLELPMRWLGSAWALAGAATPRVPHGVAVERAGTALARRGSGLLRELGSGPIAFGSRTPLRIVSQILGLIDIACEVEPGVLKPAHGRRGSAGRGRFLDALAQLRGEPLDGLTLPTLARRLGVSERQASRLFRSELESTFSEWATELRLERARGLLAQTDLPVIEVAAETGWSSLAHFNTLFRHRSGCTPSVYRVRRRGGPRPDARRGSPHG